MREAGWLYLLYSHAGTLAIAGSFAVFLVWVYYSAQIVFYGAEFTQVYATTFGSLRNKKPGDPRQPAQPEAIPEPKHPRPSVPLPAR